MINNKRTRPALERDSTNPPSSDPFYAPLEKVVAEFAKTDENTLGATMNILKDNDDTVIGKPDACTCGMAPTNGSQEICPCQADPVDLSHMLNTKAILIAPLEVDGRAQYGHNIMGFCYHPRMGMASLGVVSYNDSENAFFDNRGEWRKVTHYLEISKVGEMIAAAYRCADSSKPKMITNFFRPQLQADVLENCIHDDEDDVE